MENKKGNEIYKNLKDKSSVNLNYNTILNIIQRFQKKHTRSLQTKI